MSAEEKTDKILIGSSGFVQLGSADELKSYSGPAAFCSASPEQWKVRSGNYMNDKAKVNSEGPALLKIAGADLFKSPKKMTHIMQRLAAPEGFLPELQRSGEFYCPRLIVSIVCFRFIVIRLWEAKMMENLHNLYCILW
jgi:hypothetical protein